MEDAQLDLGQTTGGRRLLCCDKHWLPTCLPVCPSVGRVDACAPEV